MNLSSDVEDKLKIYRENFEKAYLEATEKFYKLKAPLYLEANGVQNYMRYADCKLKEEEARALRYLETGWGCNSVATVSRSVKFEYNCNSTIFGQISGDTILNKLAKYWFSAFLHVLEMYTVLELAEAALH